MYILRVKRLIPSGSFTRRGLQFRNRLLLYFVESNRRLQHEQDIETLLADILHHFGNVLGLGNRFVNRFSELLDETTKSLVQRITPNRHLQGAVLPTLLVMAKRSNLNRPADKLLPWSRKKWAARSVSGSGWPPIWSGSG